MKAYSSIDDYLKDQSQDNLAIIRAMREFLARTKSGLTRP